MVGIHTSTSAIVADMKNMFVFRNISSVAYPSGPVGPDVCRAKPYSSISTSTITTRPQPTSGRVFRFQNFLIEPDFEGSGRRHC